MVVQVDLDGGGGAGNPCGKSSRGGFYGSDAHNGTGGLIVLFSLSLARKWRICFLWFNRRFGLY